jgi:hypothetical protein
MTTCFMDEEEERAIGDPQEPDSRRPRPNSDKVPEALVPETHRECCGSRYRPGCCVHTAVAHEVETVHEHQHPAGQACCGMRLPSCCR